VAVALGSRGIDRIGLVARTLIGWLRERGAEPFVIPAMGSHGGATPEGQCELLASYGITSGALGVPIRAEMETDEIAQTASGIPVRLARVARDADAIVLVNRVKPHTDFESLTLGSGLIKMAAIGLGKIDGASRCHEAATRVGYETALGEVGRAVLSCGSRVYGVALLEDGGHHLARIEVLRGDEIPAEEPMLLQQARAWMPAIPFADVDVLVIDKAGFQDVLAANPEVAVDISALLAQRRAALHHAEEDVTARFKAGGAESRELKERILDRIRSYFGL